MENNSVIFELYDDNYSKVEVTTATKEAQKQILTYLYKRFTYEDEKARYSWAFEQGFHDGNQKVFNKKNATLPIGLIPRGVQYLKEGYPNLKVGVSEDIRKMYSNPNGELIQSELEKYTKTLKLYNPKKKKELIPYQHQYDICLRAINGRRISIMACTSSGKSLSIMIIARYLVEKEKKKVRSLHQ